MMGTNSKIEWTDHTVNPWRGCLKVAEECHNCYAETGANRFPSLLGIWGPEATGTRVVAAESQWRQIKRWNERAGEQGIRQRVFCASYADVFEDWSGPMLNADKQVLINCPECGWEPYRQNEPPLPTGCEDRPLTMNDVRARLFQLIDATPNLDWLLLTKRPENIRKFWPENRHTFTANDDQRHTFRPNCWLGTSAGTQATADRAIPELLNCRDLSPVLFVSAEPLLGQVDFSAYFGGEYVSLPGDRAEPNYNFGISWVICGGESGPHARPMHPDWARSIRDQCQAAGVPFFFKQWGEWIHLGGLPEERPVDSGYGEFHNLNADSFIADCLCDEGSQPMFRVGKKNAGRLLDGVEWNEYPHKRKPQ